MLAPHEYDLHSKVNDRFGDRWEIVGRFNADAGVTFLLLGQRYEADTDGGEAGYDPIQIVPEGQVRDTYTAAPDFTSAEAQADFQRFLAAAKASGVDLTALLNQQQQASSVEPGVPVVPPGPTADSTSLPGGSAPPAPAAAPPAAPAPPAPAEQAPAEPAPETPAPAADATAGQFVNVPGVGVLPLDQAVAQGLVQVVATPAPNPPATS